MWQGVWRIMLYLLVVLSPLVVSLIVRPSAPGSTVVYEVGRAFGLVGFMVLAVQILLTGRFKWTERAFGLDILIRQHKYVAVSGAVLLLLHPVLLAAGDYGWGLFSGEQPWYVTAGKVALFLLVANVLVSGFHRYTRLSFERWRLLHDVLAPSILLLALVHSLAAGYDLQSGPMRALWGVVFAVSIALFVYHRLVRPRLLARRPFKVTEVVPEARGVWTVRMAPPDPARLFSYLPGQFQFITFKRGRNLPVEEHHWTISSSPTEKGQVSSTIKELGDFTSTIGETRPGDEAVIHGPFGRFSYLLHPEEKRLVFIAGGIGITPLMGMLRYMRDTGATLPVVLLYANRSEEDIVFRRELAEMERGGKPRLRVVHVLSRPEAGWRGESGVLDQEKIRRYCGEGLEDGGFYVVGPPGLRDATIKNLRRLGVKDDRIHVEIFSFLD